MRRLNWHKIIHDTYVELYKNAEPQADFDELVKSATINELGEKVIPFDDYEISMSSVDSIIKSFIKRYKINKYMSEQYSRHIYLGCSPKTKTHDEISGDLC